MKNKIRELRKNRNITQKQLAKILHTNQASISRIENNKCEISPFLLNDLADVFKVSKDYFMDFNDSTKSKEDKEIAVLDIYNYDEILLKYQKLKEEHKTVVKLNIDFFYQLDQKG